MNIVSGVSGNTGRVVAETLLAQGRPVTVLVRDAAKGDRWRAKGAAVANIDLADSPALAELLSTAQGAYLLSPPNNQAPDFLADRARFLDALAQAVQTSKIPHVVFLSSVGAQHAEGTGPIRSLHYAESILKSAAPGVTILRAAYFLDNWASGLANAATDGVLNNFLTPGRAVPMISTTDIGRFAAEHLLNPVNGCQIFEVSGPFDYTPEDIAAAFSAALGKLIRLLNHPATAVAPMLESFGLSASIAALTQEMVEGVNSGHIHFEHDFRRGSITAEAAIRAMIG